MTEATSSARASTEQQGTVLVTGAAGFLGSRVVSKLSEEGHHRVIATDVVTSPKSDALAALPGVEFRALDLRDHTALELSVAESSHVVHLAAVRGQASQARPREGFEVNVGATHDLLTLAGSQGVRRFVYGSSHLVYGAFLDPHRARYVEEEGSVRPGLSLYAAAKLACEALMAPLSQTGGFTSVALRFGGIYGPGAAPDSNSGAMVAALQALDRGERPGIAWSRDTLQALIYVDDAARAVVKAVDSSADSFAVNVVGEPVSCADIYSTLVRLYGHEADVLDWQEERYRYQLVSGDRLRSDLQCPPVTTLEDGLRSIIEWHIAAKEQS